MSGGIVSFDLPMPPTTNKLFANVVIKGKQRRITTREYKAWRASAGESLMAQYARYGAPTLHKPLSLHIRLNLDHKGDIANREKALTDLLVEHLDMPDDRWIDRIVIERDRTVEAAVVTIGGAE